MITDKPPRNAARKEEFQRSEAMRTMPLPAAEPLRKYAAELQQALAQEERRDIERISNAIAAYVAESFQVLPPAVRVLGVRPLEENGDLVDETFGDYTFETMRIRLWMRTAVLEKVTSFGTFLSTLCHEICHHLDVVHFDLPNTPHTIGFYERAGLLYHYVKGTPARKLVWDRQQNGTYRIKLACHHARWHIRYSVPRY